jgi:hypothetical protein
MKRLMLDTAFILMVYGISIGIQPVQGSPICFSIPRKGEIRCPSKI